MRLSRDTIITVVGLGYVGLPLAVLAAKKDYKVRGIELSEEKVLLVNEGKNFLEDDFLKENFTAGMVAASDDPSIIKESDIVIVCVPTPVDRQYNPDLAPVRSAVAAIAQNIGKMPLIIIESTINPGVCEEVVEPIFKKHGLIANTDYHLAHCPERINPGDPKWNVTNIPRVVGAFDTAGRDRAVAFYKSILNEGTQVMPMKSVREAEATKIMENSFRDINIAFVNELAQSFSRLGIDITDVIRGASTKPFAFLPHWPSCGVGGHCIPVDPYYLIERARSAGFDHKFLKLAREINNAMPAYAVELLQDALNEVKLPLNDTTVGVLGIAYKANVGDVRESPSLKIIEHLKKHKARVLSYDPFLPDDSSEKSLGDILEKSDAIVLATNHSEFTDASPEDFSRRGVRVIIDGKNCLDKELIEKSGVVYRGIGR